MDYNQFEGVIPEGAYGGGTVMIWDKGVWAPIAEDRLGDEAEVDRQLAKGDLKFVLLGKKLLGSWVLVRTRGGRQWLLIKHRDEYAGEEDLTVSKPRSVVSGRTMAEIGRAAGGSPRQLQQAAGADPAAPPPACAGPPDGGARGRDGGDAIPTAPPPRARPPALHGAERGLARLRPPLPRRLARPGFRRGGFGRQQDARPGPRAVALLADGRRHRGDPRRRARRPAHQSPQGVLAEARAHEARPAPVLRRRGARPAAASPGPRDGDEALPERSIPGRSSS